MAIPSSLTAKIKQLPEEPGVYQMKDAKGEILYVGKAKKLRVRVKSYFQKLGDVPPRIQLLVKKIADLEVVLTDNEVEALLLESELIKKYKPKFNVALKDDKSYPYVRLDLAHPFPRLEYVRRVRAGDKKARYFGPYVSAYEIKDVLSWARKAFRLRDCSDNEFRNRARPCILHQIHQCTAPCVGFISEVDYRSRVDAVLRLLSGKIEDVLPTLQHDMDEASAREDFELAAELRDRIHHFRDLYDEKRNQKIANPESESNHDVIEFAFNPRASVFVVLSVRQGRTVGVRQFPMEGVGGERAEELWFEFLAQFFLGRKEDQVTLLPDRVILDSRLEQDLKDEVCLLERAVQQKWHKRIEFNFSKRGELKDVLQMARKTADFHLSQISSEEERRQNDLHALKERLDLRREPERIECFDISHFQGAATVASRVVFEGGRPEKTLYRHYHVREVEGPDDFKSMREVLRRRFEGDSTRPDLLVIDGGKGQLSQAIAVLEELGIQGLDVVGIAKAKTKSDFQKEEIKSSMERIYKPGQKNPIELKPGTGPHRLLTQLRDESHRFAITFHRKVRAKRSAGAASQRGKSGKNSD